VNICINISGLILSSIIPIHPLTLVEQVISGASILLALPLFLTKTSLPYEGMTNTINKDKGKVVPVL
jgi:hypothetical protein